MSLDHEGRVVELGVQQVLVCVLTKYERDEYECYYCIWIYHPGEFVMNTMVIKGQIDALSLNLTVVMTCFGLACGQLFSSV